MYGVVRTNKPSFTVGDIMAANRAPPALLTVSVALLSGVVVIGCGRGSDLPPMAKVSGTVTLNGQPLPRGTVQFVPDIARGTEGPSGVGLIDENGHYGITTTGVNGAIVGRHKISVEAEQEYDETAISMGPSLIPRRYNNPETSGLAAEVKKGEENEIPLVLSSGR